MDIKRKNTHYEDIQTTVDTRIADVMIVMLETL